MGGVDLKRARAKQSSIGVPTNACMFSELDLQVFEHVIG